MARSAPRWGVLQDLGDHSWLLGDTFDVAIGRTRAPTGRTTGRARLVAVQTDPAQQTVLLTFEAIRTDG